MGDIGGRARGLAAAVLAVFLAGGAMAQDGIRMIEGSLTYRERIALPPDTLAVVEARDARGRLLGEATLGTRGAQVPLPFSIGLPEGVEAELRAALVLGGRVGWTVAGVVVPAGTGSVSLDEIVLSRFAPIGLSTPLRCGGREISAGLFETHAVLEVEGRRRVLARGPAASGARFEAPGDPGTWVWSRGNAVLVSLAGETLPECAIVPPGPARPYCAQGDDPGWTLTVEDGRLTVAAGTLTVDAPLPEARFEDGALVYALAGPDVTLRIAPGPCRDGRTRIPHPDTVRLTLAGVAFVGCGGDPLDLLTGAEWVVEDIGGRGIVDASRVTLAVGRDGAVSGTASCNRYATGLSVGPEGLRVGQIAATRMACPAALMDQERAVFAALAAAVRFDIDPSGALLLYGADDAPVLTARR